MEFVVESESTYPLSAIWDNIDTGMFLNNQRSDAPKALEDPLNWAKRTLSQTESPHFN
jgi:hypothetical protein